MGGFREPLGTVLETVSDAFSIYLFESHVIANFNDFPSILGGIFGGFWDTFLETLIL